MLTTGKLICPQVSRSFCKTRQQPACIFKKIDKATPAARQGRNATGSPYRESRAAEVLKKAMAVRFFCFGVLEKKEVMEKEVKRI